jgi:cytidine deaminase
MDVSLQDNDLIDIAKKLVKREKIPGGSLGTVASAMRTSTGRVFTGVCLHLVCGLGFCAEATAIATAVTNQKNVEIDTIVAVKDTGIVEPCGRCRELMNVLSEKGFETWVIMNEHEKVQIADLLPRAWKPTKSSDAGLEV